MFSARLARQVASRVPMATRSYASAAGAASTKPPIPLFGVDGTYASALVSTGPICPIGNYKEEKAKADEELMLTVHRCRQVICSRTHRQGPRNSRRRLQEGHQVASRP